MTGPALLLLELDSVAAGIAAGDAMAKRAPLALLRAGTVHPGKYLLLAAGEVAPVEEARAAGRERAGESLASEIFLPAVHAGVVTALAGERAATAVEALGVVETSTAAAAIGAADAGLKGAAVALLALRLADGLGGKGYVLFAGAVADVEAAVELGAASLADESLLVARAVVAQLHPEMLANLAFHPRFWPVMRLGEG